MAAFTAKTPKQGKPTRGRTGTRQTPLSIRGDPRMDADAARQARTKVTRALGSMAPRIERITIRFEDVNGPRQGVDTLCRIKAVVSGEGSLVVQEKGKNPTHALALATPRMKRSLRQLFDRRGGKMPAPTHAERAARPRVRTPRDDQGSFIGRRVGRAQRNLDAALDRPEKRRRDAYVDTAAPGTSASDRRAGGGSTARRNSKRPTRRMTATLEDSRTKPSRKSTRKSANRTRSGNKKAQRERRRTTSPRARHSRGK
jgi:hypothetical protein